MLRAVLLVFLLFLNLALWGTLVLLGGVVKALTFGRARHRVVMAMAWLADRWVQGNGRIFDWLLSTEWEVEGLGNLRRDGRYLVISNHISWVDIFAVFRALHDRTAFIRFFLKQILIWFPIAGQACWTLDFPFMRRYSPEYLKKHPEKRGRDLETTRRACRRYEHIPVTILNFVEGTRFTRQKHEDQQSPYRHLLRPRIGGVGFVLASLGDHLDAMIDLTIIYPRRDVTLLEFLSNRVPWIRVQARHLEIPAEFIGAAITEPGPSRDRFKAWIETVWERKDDDIDSVVRSTHRADGH